MRVVPALVLSFLCVPFAGMARGGPPAVAVLRCPDGGFQPQAAVDDRGGVHLIYLKGDPAHCDIFYTRSADGGATWAKAARVNHDPGSAIALGTVRGPHLALGGRRSVHVAWMGSAQAKGEGKSPPLLYAHLDDDQFTFVGERNVIQEKWGLDGGGSIAADPLGNVYFAWHAPEHAAGNEADRRVYFSKSVDTEFRLEGVEGAISGRGAGVCACCGMRLFADRHRRLYVLYRSATDQVHRDLYLLTSGDQGGTFQSYRVGPMQAGTCIMSTAALAEAPPREGQTHDGAGKEAATGETANEPPGKVLAAWENLGQIQWAWVDGKTGQPAPARNVPGQGDGRKHPAAAVNGRGEFLLAWDEGTGWARGGSVAWQVFDAEGRPMPGKAGRAPGLPAWGLPAAFVRPDGSFAVLY